MTFMWACESCSKTFSRKGDLTRHKHLHTGYKPYVCRDCGKSFAQFSGLKTHRNVHTKVKPFVCELDGCTAVFGDPSSCTRHRKERHQTIGAYRCPVSICKSSIKRRSAFRLHLRKHGIDPDTVDIAALAPTLLPRQTFQRQKPQPSSPVHKAFDATPNILYSNNNHAYTFSDFAYSNASSYNLPHSGSYAMDGCLSVERSTMQSPGMPAIPTDSREYTINTAPSPPDLDFSMSPSPTPSHNDLVRTPEQFSRPPSANYIAPHSFCSSPNSSPSSLSRLSPLFFSEGTFTEHPRKQRTWDSNAESLLFGNSLVSRF